jgi:hypothetical protein
MNPRESGQSASEFLVIFPVLVFLVFGIIQFGLLYQGRATLNYATLLAARAGATHNGHAGEMRNALARGLLPLFAKEASPAGYAKALEEAQKETAALADIVTIEVLNPTKAALADFGRDRLDGEAGKELPNDTLNYRSTSSGDSSGLSVQDANILHLRVTYCYRLIVPVIGRMLHAAVNAVAAPSGGSGMGNPFGIAAPPGAGARCAGAMVKGPRIEIRSEVMVRMQSAFYQAYLDGGGGAGTPADPGVPYDPSDPSIPFDPPDPVDPIDPGGPVCP